MGITSICDSTWINKQVKYALENPRVWLALGTHPKTVGQTACQLRDDMNACGRGEELSKALGLHDFNSDWGNNDPPEPFDLGWWSWEHHHYMKAMMSLMSRPEVRARVRSWGEIGLDYSHRRSVEEDLYGPTQKVIQRAVFRDQLALARKFGLPVQIHTRAAEQDTVDVLLSEAHAHPEWARKVGIHLHACFNSDTFLRLLMTVFPRLYVGVACSLESQNTNLYYGTPTQEKPRYTPLSPEVAKAVAAFPPPELECGLAADCSPDREWQATRLMKQIQDVLPLERIVVETDAPYLPRKSAERFDISLPKMIPDTIRAIAELKGIPAREAAKQIRTNSRELYGV